MPMMIVDDSEFNLESERLGILPPSEDSEDASEDDTRAPVAEVREINRGRGTGNKEVPESLRKLIGENALVETHKETAEAFGVSESSVSAYKHGSTSTATYDKPEESLANHIDERKRKISDKARAKLLLAMNHITGDKLAESSVKVLSGVARDMSSVIKNMEPAQQGDGPSAQFIFFAPKQRDERDFKVIEVGDQ